MPFWNKSKSAIAFWLFLTLWKAIYLRLKIGDGGGRLSAKLALALASGQQMLAEL